MGLSITSDEGRYTRVHGVRAAPYYLGAARVARLGVARRYTGGCTPLHAKGNLIGFSSGPMPAQDLIREPSSNLPNFA
jgi:hypothetical protein